MLCDRIRTNARNQANATGLDVDKPQADRGAEQSVRISSLTWLQKLRTRRGNSRLSGDSRDFGPVALGDILGVVEYIYLPGDTWSRFGALR
jgi:hypothetical protein